MQNSSERSLRDKSREIRFPFYLIPLHKLGIISELRPLSLTLTIESSLFEDRAWDSFLKPESPSLLVFFALFEFPSSMEHSELDFLIALNSYSVPP